MAPPASLRLSFGETIEGAGDRRNRGWPQLVHDLGTLTTELIDDLTLVPERDLYTSSLCEGWTASDVLAHLALGDRLAAEAIEAAHTSAPAPFVNPRDTGFADANMNFEDFRRCRGRLLDAMAALEPEASFLKVPWTAGEITVTALVQSRLMETWIHGWDIRWPIGMVQRFDDRCWWLADIAVRHIPYALGLATGEMPRLGMSVRLTGSAAGTWQRSIGGPSAQLVAIDGPAWAWVTWASRRTPAQVSLAYLNFGEDDLSRLVLDTARSFA